MMSVMATISGFIFLGLAVLCLRQFRETHNKRWRKRWRVLGLTCVTIGLVAFGISNSLILSLK